MAEYLVGPAEYAPDDRAEPGDPVPKRWPKWFVDDLREAGHLTKTAPKPTTGVPPSLPEPVPLRGTSTRARKGRS